MTHGLFNSILFSFHVLGDFPVISLLLSPNLSPLWSENIMYDFSSFKFVEVCFVAQDMVYFGMFHWHLVIIYIQLLLSGTFYKCQLFPVG